MKVKVAVLGLFLGTLVCSSSIKRVFIPADPPKFKLPNLVDFSPHPGIPPVAAKVPNYFPPFPPPVENKKEFAITVET